MTEEAPPTNEVREFVIAGHGNLDRVKEMLAARPMLLNMAHEWGPGDTETALQGAAHVGNRAIAEYLLAQGAPLDICTAAMLGRRSDIEVFLQEDVDRIQAAGAHGISLLTHAALSGDVALVQMLYERGATSGASLALTLAVTKGYVETARWLLENAAPDVAWKNFQGKSVLEIARDNGNAELVELLGRHGAVE